MNPDITAHRIADDGVFPNNATLPLLLYKQALPAHTPDMASTFENAFHAHGWGNSWRNGIYTFHHYHSTAHEVLGIARGSATVQFGGPTGIIVDVNHGDMVIVPAGVAHKLLQSANLLVIGAYPQDQSPDMCFGKPGERPQADNVIVHVALPISDPCTGGKTPLLEHWSPQ